MLSSDTAVLLFGGFHARSRACVQGIDRLWRFPTRYAAAGARAPALDRGAHRVGGRLDRVAVLGTEPDRGDGRLGAVELVAQHEGDRAGVEVPRGLHVLDPAAQLAVVVGPHRVEPRLVADQDRLHGDAHVALLLVVHQQHPVAGHQLGHLHGDGQGLVVEGAVDAGHHSGVGVDRGLRAGLGADLRGRVGRRVRTGGGRRRRTGVVRCGLRGVRAAPDQGRQQERDDRGVRRALESHGSTMPRIGSSGAGPHYRVACERPSDQRSSLLEGLSARWAILGSNQ